MTDFTDFSPEERAEIETELASFIAEETERLGIPRLEQWTEPMHSRFTASERPHTTILFGGLTIAHDTFVEAAMVGIGYRLQRLSCPDNDALQFGKEFGNRGQCNPTYFTVGNLIKYLIHLRDEQGMPTEEIIARYVFVTTGSCGPCRFGMYTTEFRKALRDADFGGFRVLMFQQTEGLKQATGEADGLEINASFAAAFTQALFMGDVLNLLGYRLRPYEVESGAVDAAMAECHEIVCAALRKRRTGLRALWRCRQVLGAVELDRIQPKPIVSVIGEFWAMTTEGDGNYALQRFLEAEGAEVDIQPIVNWLLYLIWDAQHDIEQRITLKRVDRRIKARASAWWKQVALDRGARALFQLYANVAGLHSYRLPDMAHIADLAAQHYDLNVKGGEGHMEVGKLIHFVEDKVNHMTVSVKPFGCMPSSGVSDGVQSLVTAKWPEAIFVPIETTGDQKVNAHSRVQMMLFKARQKARQEFDAALLKHRYTRESLRARLKRSWRFRSNFARPRHLHAGLAANLAEAMR